jgi:magnesium chelatase family protein
MMNLAKVYARARVGIDAPSVAVEVHLSNGLPSMSIVGLPETAVKESRDRVRSAIINSGFEFPARRIVVNLAPAELPKEGGRFDLAIAMALLVASKQIPDTFTDQLEVLGELALNGDVRPIQGVLPASMAATAAGKSMAVPAANANEACLPEAAEIIPVANLLVLCHHVAGTQLIGFATRDAVTQITYDPATDLTQVRGQTVPKKALEVAAAGQHNLLYFGPPGTGKTLLARCLPSILPALTETQQLETMAIHSIAGYGRLINQQRPFRAPHHTASGVALVGGGSNPRPGEISLAHHGVLFLDELPEFSRQVLDVLREPLEQGEIVISRAARQVTFPAQFQLIAAMNPTPGGYAPNDPRSGHYTKQHMQKYLARLSGPFLDRIDLQVEVNAIEPELLARGPQGESSADVRLRVANAYQRQMARQGKANAQLSPNDIERHCRLSSADEAVLHKAMTTLGLSARSYHRVLKVSRTVADLEGATAILTPHLLSALGYRQMDKWLQ